MRDSSGILQGFFRDSSVLTCQSCPCGKGEGGRERGGGWEDSCGGLKNCNEFLEDSGRIPTGFSADYSGDFYGFVGILSAFLEILL